MKKVTILALHLGYGGIEKCVSDVANLLCDKYDVEILCTYKLYDKEVYDIDSRVKITYLTDVIPNRKEFLDAVTSFKFFTAFKEGLKSIKVLRLKRSSMIKKLKEHKSDVYISTRIYFNNILGNFGNGLKIGWEHNHHHGNFRYIKNFMKSCKKLNKVVLVSEELNNYYSKLFKDKKLSCKCEYISNFIDNSNTKLSKLNNKNIVSVGRLAPEKGYSDLIDVFKIIELKDGDTRLDIVGDGLEYENIKSKIIDLNLTRKITLHGYKDIDFINDLYSKSSIYLMASYTESFGLVLVEAMSHGVVPIAFDSAEGARDIIKNNSNGILIKNRNEYDMAEAALKLLNNKDKLKEMSKNAYQSSKKYGKDVAKRRWKEVIEGE